MNGELVWQLLEWLAGLAERVQGKWVELDTDEGRAAGYVCAVGHDGDSYWVQLDDDERIQVTAEDLAVMLSAEPAEMDVQAPLPGRRQARRRPVLDVPLPGD
jgi:hypothetical protein